MEWKRPVWPCAVVLIFAVGCNNSRYGVHYNERLPGIQRVGVMVPSVKVYSLHTGGVQEARPDLAPALEEATRVAIREEVVRCKREPVLLKTPVPSPEKHDDPAMTRTALLGAISESIVVHHYTFGKERTIDYVSGDASTVLGQADVDAILCVYVNGLVPTSGREGLRTTALVMGVLTGIHIRVQTEQASLVAMLVDAKTGEILWFNLVSKEIKVDDKKAFRKLCKNACEYLLRPNK